MYVYTIRQWLLFFYFYCFFGWVFESVYVSVKKHKFVNRGFMRGPFLPLYGSGAILILFATIPVRDYSVLVYLLGAAAATLLEYVTGVVMEKLFKVRYWDYTKNKFNFQGHICLGCSIAWGFLSLFLVRVIHKPVEQVIMKVSEYSYLEEILVFGITIYFVADMTIAFREALELRDLLLYVEKAKAETERLKKRLDVALAVADDEISQKKELVKEKTQLYTEALENSISDYKNRLSGHNGRLAKRILNAHPTMNSVRFKDAVAELKERICDSYKEK